MSNTNKGKFYGATEKYVNEIVAEYLKGIGNIESVKCKFTGLDGEGFIELVHEDGTARYFDIQGLTISQIGIMIGYIVANKAVRNELHDSAVKREIRKLFK